MDRQAPEAQPTSFCQRFWRNRSFHSVMVIEGGAPTQPSTVTTYIIFQCIPKLGYFETWIYFEKSWYFDFETLKHQYFENLTLLFRYLLFVQNIKDFLILWNFSLINLNCSLILLFFQNVINNNIFYLQNTNNTRKVNIIIRQSIFFWRKIILILSGK